MERYKAIFHINESEKWSTVLANINNLIKDLGKDDVVVEIVANGYAVVSGKIKWRNFGKQKGRIISSMV